MQNLADYIDIEAFEIRIQGKPKKELRQDFINLIQKEPLMWNNEQVLIYDFTLNQFVFKVDTVELKGKSYKVADIKK